MAETASSLTPPDLKSGWMNLWLTVEGDDSPLWHGIQYRVLPSMDGSKGELCRFNPDSSKRWEKTADVFAKVQERRVIYSFNADLIRFDLKKTQTLRFKWSDNMQNENDTIDWIINGDAAPNGRAMYRWKNSEK